MKLVKLPPELEMFFLDNGIKIVNVSCCYSCKNLNECINKDLICKNVLIKGEKK